MVTTIAALRNREPPALDPLGGARPEPRPPALVLIGVLLACVGIFPVDQFLAAHNIAAIGMVIVYVTLVVSLRRLLPSMPRVFVLLGYTYVGVIVVLAIFFITGYYNLTAVELVAAVLIFSWIIVFLRNSGAVETSRNAPTSRDASASPRVSAAPGSEELVGPQRPGDDPDVADPAVEALPVPLGRTGGADDERPAERGDAASTAAVGLRAIFEPSTYITVRRPSLTTAMCIQRPTGRAWLHEVGSASPARG